MKISETMMVFVLIGVISTAMFSFYGEIATNYEVENASMLTGYQANLSTLSDSIYLNINTTQDAIEGRAGALEVLYTTPAIIWGALMTILTLPAVMLTLTSGAGNAFSTFGLPVYIINAIYIIFLVYVVFKVISLITGRDA